MLFKAYIPDDDFTKVIRAFANSQYEFRTYSIVAQELGMKPEQVMTVIGNYRFFFMQSQKDPNMFGISDGILRMMGPIPAAPQIQQTTMEEMLGTL